MKKIILTIILLSATSYANDFKNGNCNEYQLGNSDSYIVTCDNKKFKVTYHDFNRKEVVDFQELGKTKKHSMVSKPIVGQGKPMPTTF